MHYLDSFHGLFLLPKKFSVTIWDIWNMIILINIWNKSSTYLKNSQPKLLYHIYFLWQYTSFIRVLDIDMIKKWANKM
jgi:hypothetical protein